MIKFGLFLDDERQPSDVTWLDFDYSQVEWIVLNNHKDFIFFISNCDYDLISCISFDHDIQSYDTAGYELTGYHCLKQLIDFCFENDTLIPKCIFHTQNPVGKSNMEHYYNNAIEFQRQR